MQNLRYTYVAIFTDFTVRNIYTLHPFGPLPLKFSATTVKHGSLNITSGVIQKERYKIFYTRKEAVELNFHGKNMWLTGFLIA